MLCTLAVHFTREATLVLRVTGMTAVGPSGTGGRGTQQYPTAEALFRDLDVFGLGDEVTNAAARALENPEARKRFINFAENVQIPFDMLEHADIYLFDLG